MGQGDTALKLPEIVQSASQERMQTVIEMQGRRSGALCPNERKDSQGKMHGIREISSIDALKEKESNKSKHSLQAVSLGGQQKPNNRVTTESVTL